MWQVSFGVMTPQRVITQLQLSFFCIFRLSSVRMCCNSAYIDLISDAEIDCFQQKISDKLATHGLPSTAQQAHSQKLAGEHSGASQRRPHWLPTKDKAFAPLVTLYPLIKKLHRAARLEIITSPWAVHWHHIRKWKSHLLTHKYCGNCGSHMEASACEAHF